MARDGSIPAVWQQKAPMDFTGWHKFLKITPNFLTEIKESGLIF
jgi:hypothetical protein